VEADRASLPAALQRVQLLAWRRAARRDGDAVAGRVHFLGTVPPAACAVAFLAAFLGFEEAFLPQRACPTAPAVMATALARIDDFPGWVLPLLPPHAPGCRFEREYARAVWGEEGRASLREAVALLLPGWLERVRWASAPQRAAMARLKADQAAQRWNVEPADIRAMLVAAVTPQS
jgi:hypothetical protein